jgi:hypothetical protein
MRSPAGSEKAMERRPGMLCCISPRDLASLPVSGLVMACVKLARIVLIFE